MQLGMIGLGRMGANLTRRLLRGGHEVVVYDHHPEVVAQLEAEGAIGAASTGDLVGKLAPPRAVWVMIPAAYVEAATTELAGLLDHGDAVLDGGNSYYRDDLLRAQELSAHGIDFVDIGTSGGVFGLERGFCLMIGGTPEVVARLEPIFATLASGADAAPRSPGRTGEVAQAERGYLHCGPTGAGHFVKMVHNGIEYGVMAAYAEGLAILAKADLGHAERLDDAETAPLAHPEHYQYDIAVPDVAEVWRRGSVISSWLLDLTASALGRDPDLRAFDGRVSDSGEGRWTVVAAVEEGVPAHVLTAALYERFSSRGEADVADRILSAMRKEFGGHEERKR